jgi:hypothetical protein
MPPPVSVQMHVSPPSQLLQSAQLLAPHQQSSPQVWYSLLDEEGDEYYWNPATGNTTWEVPEEAIVLPAAAQGINAAAQAQSSSGSSADPPPIMASASFDTGSRFEVAVRSPPPLGTSASSGALFSRKSPTFRSPGTPSPASVQVLSWQWSAQPSPHDPFLPSVLLPHLQHSSLKLQSSSAAASTPTPKASLSSSTPLAKLVEAEYIFSALEKNDAVKLLSLRWLLAHVQSPSFERLDRRQDLDKAAFIDVKALRDLHAKAPPSVREKTVPIVSISYCWLGKNHPDEKGEQLEHIAAVLQEQNRRYSLYYDDVRARQSLNAGRDWLSHALTS